MTKKSGAMVLGAAGLVLLGIGCAGGGDVRPGGRGALEDLRGGMSIEEAVAVLGLPTSRTTVRPGRVAAPVHELVYIDSVVDPGTLSLVFDPGLAVIRVDNAVWRDFREEQR
ncbi:MAG TPA: hypothetical protein PLI51_01025 [bacterium]|nr:hypothetical protein [bacterium]HPQ65295.1 hypothetical protein [bacterium]